MNYLRPLTVALMFALLATSCSSTRNHAPIVVPQSKLGRVTDISMDLYTGSGGGRRTSTGIFAGGMLGSFIGSGASANAAGALGGMLLGGLLGNRADEGASTAYRRVTVKLNEGSSLHVTERITKKSQPLSVGDTVVVNLDSQGVPLRVMPISG